jgi:hypothetical protein
MRAIASPLAARTMLQSTRQGGLGAPGRHALLADVEHMDGVNETEPQCFGDARRCIPEEILRLKLGQDVPCCGNIVEELAA